MQETGMYLLQTTIPVRADIRQQANEQNGTARLLLHAVDKQQQKRVHTLVNSGDIIVKVGPSSCA
jgi:hypothetical protein